MSSKNSVNNTRMATSFSAEELKLWDTLIKIMLRGGNPIVIPAHLVRHRAFGPLAGKLSRMMQKSQGHEVADEL